MKFIVAFALLTTGARAFLPASRTFVAPVVQTTKAPFSKTARSFGVDPSFFHDLPQHFDSLQNALTTVTLSDAADLAPGVAEGVDVDAAAASGNGWFGFLVGPISGLLVIIHSAMVAAGMSANAWGISIIILTLTIKALTFPLTKTQLEGTSKMQAMQPAIKELQAKYQSNPEVMNQKISEFYQENEVNPLAGCIPSLVQIPVFIGLYRAVLTLAKDNVLDEGFLWLPSLEGPTFGADPAHGSDWILKGWIDGIPSLGWETTIAYLILPCLLVVSQFASMQLMQPKTDDPAQQQGNAILKFLPLMIGWFSLNVPSALCIYWITNNVVTTASSVFIRNNVAAAAATAGPKSTTVQTSAASKSVFAPPREKPSGFGASPSAGSDGVKPITSIDAEIEEELDDDAEDDDEDHDDSPTSSEPVKKKRGKNGKKAKKAKN